MFLSQKLALLAFPGGDQGPGDPDAEREGQEAGEGGADPEGGEGAPRGHGERQRGHREVPGAHQGA